MSLGRRGRLLPPLLPIVVRSLVLPALYAHCIATTIAGAARLLRRAGQYTCCTLAASQLRHLRYSTRNRINELHASRLWYGTQPYAAVVLDTYLAFTIDTPTGDHSTQYVWRYLLAQPHKLILIFDSGGVPFSWSTGFKLNFSAGVLVLQLNHMTFESVGVRCRYTLPATWWTDAYIQFGEQNWIALEQRDCFLYKREEKRHRLTRWRLIR